MGLSVPNSSRAAVALITATSGVSGRSCASNVRPVNNGISIVSKNSGETVIM